MTERDGGRASLLAANSHLEVAPRLPTFFHGDSHQVLQLRSGTYRSDTFSFLRQTRPRTAAGIQQDGPPWNWDKRPSASCRVALLRLWRGRSLLAVLFADRWGGGPASCRMGQFRPTSGRRRSSLLARGRRGVAVGTCRRRMSWPALRRQDDGRWHRVVRLRDSRPGSRRIPSGWSS